jgi:hypothetical protein
MPTAPTPPDDWIRVEHQAAKAEVLAAAEVKPFLTWLFGDVGTKLKPLALRETASVVRYLMWLAIAGVPKEIISRGTEAVDGYCRNSRSDKQQVQKRNEVEAFAKIVWEDLLQSGPFKASSNVAAKKFFKEHSGQWHHSWLQSVLDLLEKFEVPRNSVLPFGPKAMRARGVAHSRVTPTSTLISLNGLPQPMSYCEPQSGRRRGA